MMSQVRALLAEFRSGELSEWLKEHAWKACIRFFRIEGSNPSFSVFLFLYWPLGQAVKTPPFHGGNTGSNPVGVIKWFSGAVAQLVEQRIEAPCVGSSTLSSAIAFWRDSEVAKRGGL